MARHSARAIRAFGKFWADEFDEADPYSRLKLPKEPEPSAKHTRMATEEDLQKLLATCDRSTFVGVRSVETNHDRRPHLDTLESSENAFGDHLTLDWSKDQLYVDVSDEELAARTPAPQPNPGATFGRSLMKNMRSNSTPADQGASFIL